MRKEVRIEIAGMNSSLYWSLRNTMSEVGEADNATDSYQVSLRDIIRNQSR